MTLKREGGGGIAVEHSISLDGKTQTFFFFLGGVTKSQTKPLCSSTFTATSVSESQVEGPSLSASNPPDRVLGTT